MSWTLPSSKLESESGSRKTQADEGGTSVSFPFLFSITFHFPVDTIRTASGRSPAIQPEDVEDFRLLILQFPGSESRRPSREANEESHRVDFAPTRLIYRD